MNNHEIILNNNDSQLDSLIKKMAQDHQAQLPSPDLIWWRAQILKKQEQQERVERPMVIMRMLAATVCLAVFLGLLAGNWNQLHFGIWHEAVPLFMPLAIVAGIISVIGIGLLFRSPRTKPAKH